MVHIKFVLFCYLILLTSISIAGITKICSEAVKSVTENFINGKYDQELTQNKYYPILIEIKESSEAPVKFENYNAILWLKKSSTDDKMPKLIYTKVNNTSALPLCTCCNESFIVEEMSEGEDGTRFTTKPKEILNEFLCHEFDKSPIGKSLVIWSDMVPPLCHHFMQTIRTAESNHLNVTKKSIKESLPDLISTLLACHKVTKWK